MDSQAKLNISSETDDATHIPRRDEKTCYNEVFGGEHGRPPKLVQKCLERTEE